MISRGIPATKPRYLGAGVLSKETVLSHHFHIYCAGNEGKADGLCFHQPQLWCSFKIHSKTPQRRWCSVCLLEVLKQRHLPEPSRFSIHRRQELPKLSRPRSGISAPRAPSTLNRKQHGHHFPLGALQNKATPQKQHGSNQL